MPHRWHTAARSATFSAFLCFTLTILPSVSYTESKEGDYRLPGWLHCRAAPPRLAGRDRTARFNLLDGTSEDPTAWDPLVKLQLFVR